MCATQDQGKVWDEHHQRAECHQVQRELGLVIILVVGLLLEDLELGAELLPHRFELLAGEAVGARTVITVTGRCDVEEGLADGENGLGMLLLLGMKEVGVALGDGIHVRHRYVREEVVHGGHERGGVDDLATLRAAHGRRLEKRAHSEVVERARRRRLSAPGTRPP